MELKGARLAKWTVNCPKLQLTGEGVYVSRAELTYTDGMADISTTQAISTFNCDLTSDTGTVYINGNALGNSFSQSASNGATWIIHTENGTIAMQNATSPILGSSYDTGSTETKTESETAE